ncbi:MAG TPA: putative peptidoglycan glycosyltransferase FtsW [Spirochaetales bacterium]|nr:putative peptidoglycan glycosyltransferase FtsW [Spirochaetales bacterium]HRY54105.1 putative peptidoglycan glycosyltransferase FtsW [Spirochaetia bacterium]HRZ64086.1 putative peptidoglycan glycosyltransferase FtsW [Spirochaetia bacterium]
MRIGFEAERTKAALPGDAGLLAATFLLAGTGFAALWSASSGYALSLGKEAQHFALRQALFMLPALLVYAASASIPLERLRSRVVPITLGALATLVLPFVPGLGENRNGASRWISLGFTTFQPSELWKLASILYLAHILDRRAREGGSLAPPLLIAALGCLAVYLQNDFSTAVIVGAAAAAMFWIAGAPPSFFLGLGAAAAPLAALSVLTSDFRLRRILAFLFPAYEPHGQGYQVLGSLRAIRSGGFLGKGIGLGTMKLSSVPEVQSDFVFAAWAEETGFLGVAAFFLLWAFFSWRALRAAFAEEDPFRSYLGAGLAALLLLEVSVNVAVAGGLVPATGIALPFFSAGGTSLLSTACACGALYNLSRGRSGERESGARARAESLGV